jgi:hypothetical protein
VRENKRIDDDVFLRIKAPHVYIKRSEPLLEEASVPNYIIHDRETYIAHMSQFEYVIQYTVD